jgi:hypothetical protein
VVTADLDALVDAGDREYVAQISDAAQREVVVSTLLRYRVPEQLAVGDPVPAAEVTALDPPRVVRLDRLVRDRPVMLVFGSYT